MHSIDLTSLLALLITIIGVVYTLCYYFKQKRNQIIRHLAMQIQLYYDEEVLFAEEVAKLREELKSRKSHSKETIRREFRALVEKDDVKINETRSSVIRFFK